MTGGRRRAAFRGSILGQLLIGGLLAAGLLAGGVTVAVVGGIHQQSTINALTRVVQPLQVANTDLRSGFSQCQNWYLEYELTSRPNYLSAYRTCNADFQLTLESALRLTPPGLVPLIRSQQRAARAWFAVADQAAGATSKAKARSLTTRAIGASVSFFASNAQTQQLIDRARDREAQAGRNSLASEFRYGAIFIGAVLVSLAAGGALVVRSVLRPLAALNPTLSRLAAGDHGARATVTRPMEIAAVAGSINNLAEEGERLRHAEQERVRLLALAREAGIRIRAHLHANSVVREAVTTLERDLDVDLVYVQLIEDGQLGMPWTADGPSADLSGQLPDTVWEWAQDLFRRRLAAEDLSRKQAQRLPAEIREPLLRCGYVSDIWMPLGVGDELLGMVVGLRTNHEHQWMQVEISAFEWIAADLGRGLKYAQIYEEEGRLVEQLRLLDRAKSDFMATMSHELRTPLASIIGYTEILREGEAGPLSQVQHGMVETITRNATRLQNLIEDVLMLSKIETGAFKAVLRPVRLAEVISSAVTAMSPAAERRTLTLTSEEIDPELTVNGDEDQIDRLLMNLLSNAVKFTPPGGRVAISARRRGKVAVVQVADTGMGIPEKDKADLFGRFFRASNAVRAAVPGSGLGLSIVRTIVANHGGDIDLRSQEGKGTTVTVRLPVPSAVGGAGRVRPSIGGRGTDEHGS